MRALSLGVLLGALLLASGAWPSAAQGAPATGESPTGPLEFTPEVSADSRAEQGGVIRVRARSSEGIDAMSTFLADAAGGVVALGTCFPQKPAAPEPSWDGLIGVPSTLRHGDYRIVVSTRRLGRAGLRLLAVTVARRGFGSENISLSQSLSELRTLSDPRKIEEAHRLAALLAVARPEDLLERGAFLLPVEGAVRTAGFGDRREYRYAEGGGDSAVHNGLDLALPEGRPVAACGRGRVVLSEERIVTGNSIVIEHLPGVFSLYFHMSELAVKEGDLVERGALIGHVGRTGLATGPHLHWEVRVLGVAVDPERFVRSPVLDKGPDSSIMIGNSADTPGEGR